MNMGQDTMKDICSRQDVRFSGGKGFTDTVCKIGNSTQTAHTVITFTGNVAYHSEIHSHMQPPLYGDADSMSVIDAKWVGPCPANMIPGDMLLSNGMKMHVKTTAH